MAFATPLSSKRTVSLLAYAAKPSTSCKSIAMSSAGQSTILCSLSNSTATWIKGYKSCATSETLIGLPLRAFSCLSTLGIHAPSWAPNLPLHSCGWVQICTSNQFFGWETHRFFSAPGTVMSYSKDLAMGLKYCRNIAVLLVWEQHCWHRKLIHSWCGNPRIYHKGDIVFAHRTTRSNAKCGYIDKLMYPFTGP